MKFCFNGKLFDSTDQIQLPIFDEAIMYGRSVFETLHTYHHNQIFAPKEHLQRLFTSAKILQIPPFCDEKTVIEWLQKTVCYNAQKENDLKIRILLAKNFCLITTEILQEMPESWYKKGVEIIDTVFERPFPEAKSTSPAYKFFMASQPQNVFETIFFDRQGFLREGNIGNVFAVFGNKVVTPDERILKGVTRKKVIELIKSIETKQELSLQLREISRDELQKADEIFLTNTTKKVVPIKKWGTWEKSDFTVAKMLRTKFQKMYTGSIHPDQ